MTLPIQDAWADVYLGYDRAPSPDDTPDLTIPAEDLQHVEISARTDEVMDEGSMTLWNHDGQYTVDEEITAGDRIEFHAPMGEKVPYGNGWYGGGIYGGVYPITWTGRVLDIDDTRDQYDRGTLDIELAEYVGDILSDRKVTNSYLGEDVGFIIRDIVDRKAPEVDASDVPDLGVTTDIKYSSRNAWDAVLRLAARADATVIPDGMRIQVNPIADLPRTQPIEKRDYFTPISTSTDDDIKNVIRINSGKNRKIESEQTDFDHYTRADETNRITHRLRARKSEVHSVNLYVNRIESDKDDTPSGVEPGDELKVRLQSDENGAPIAPDDADSDITSASWGYDNLPAGDWQAFFFDEHTLADRDPWLLIETDGDTGHDIGVDANDNLTYQSYYPHPLTFEVQDNESVNQYGPREKTIERGTLKTLSATRDVAQSELARRAWPEKTVEFEVSSPDAHYIAPGDVAPITVPGSNTPGEFIVTEVNHEWDSDSVVLHTTITATWRKGVLAPQSN